MNHIIISLNYNDGASLLERKVEMQRILDDIIAKHHVQMISDAADLDLFHQHLDTAMQKGNFDEQIGVIDTQIKETNDNLMKYKLNFSKTLLEEHRNDANLASLLKAFKKIINLLKSEKVYETEILKYLKLQAI